MGQCKTLPYLIEKKIKKSLESIEIVSRIERKL
jgi:hypothetical protein